MGSSILRPEQAWDVLGQLIDDPRVVVIDQAPQTHAQHWRANVEKREPGSLAIAPSLDGRGAVLRETPFSPPDLWTDAWLAALAQATDSEMTTFDKGFRSFPKLKLRLLSAATP